MKKFALTLIAISLLALPALAGAQDPYEENPPTVPGGNGGGSGGGSGSPTAPGTVPGTAPGTAGAAGVTGTASGTSASGSLTEAQAQAAGTAADSGQLPATGFDETGVMAVLGALLVGGGLLVRRRALVGD